MDGKVQAHRDRSAGAVGVVRILTGLAAGAVALIMAVGQAREPATWMVQGLTDGDCSTHDCGLNHNQVLV